MKEKIIIKHVSIEEAVRVNATVIEFGEPYSINYFEERYHGRDRLIVVAYFNDQAVGYIVGYDRYRDGSFYCWMAGVNPAYRKMGVLKALMAFEEVWAKEKGYKKIKIKTRNDRREMLAYLVKYGFLFIEVIQYPNPLDSRILLEKPLLKSV